MEKARRVKSKHAAESSKGHGFGKVLLALFLIIILMAAAACAWYFICLGGTGTAEEEVSFEVGLGSSTDKIATILKDNGVIRSKEVFKIYVKLNKISNFQAGKYTITKDMKVPEIAEALQNGILYKNTGYNITFIEGKTFPYVAKTIAEKTNNTEQDVYDLLKDKTYIDSLINDYWFITDEIKNTDIYYSLEGYLFPDTYSFDSKDVEVKDIFKVMLDKMEKVLNKYKTDVQTSGHSVHDILSMASIIENEAIHDKDRKNISSVLYNRLNVKMSLGSDVTTYYAFRVELRRKRPL